MSPDRPRVTWPFADEYRTGACERARRASSEPHFRTTLPHPECGGARMQVGGWAGECGLVDDCGPDRVVGLLPVSRCLLKRLAKGRLLRAHEVRGSRHFSQVLVSQSRRIVCCGGAARAEWGFRRWVAAGQACIVPVQGHDSKAHSFCRSHVAVRSALFSYFGTQGCSNSAPASSGVVGWKTTGVRRSRWRDPSGSVLRLGRLALAARSGLLLVRRGGA